jgi:muramoyltetrapeptide carboxypeptidase
MRLPPLLGPGARVALVAPSGPLRGHEDLDRAIASVRRMGWEPVAGDHVLERAAYLAGRDADRVADLNRAAADPDIDAVWCIRGGYGAMRILPLVDYDAWRARPKALIGYSDITALHAAIGARADLVTFHGPTAREDGVPFSVESMRRVLTCGEDPCGVAARATTVIPGRASGRLVGGNLALLASLAGTPYAPDYRGAILVLEDVNESVYRIDRLLSQLRLTGCLDDIAGLGFGWFSDIPTEALDDDEGVDRVLREFAAALGRPCLSGIPMGHAGAQWTIPLGATAELDADAHSLTVHL